MITPEVTVLTAAYNAGAFIHEAIESIQSQTFQNWEYLIVDDASEDNTCEVVERYATQDPRIHLIRREVRGGPFAAANTALPHARGKYVVRMDADDLSPVQRIELQIQFLESHPEFRACITPWQSFNSAGLIPGSVTRMPLTWRGFKWFLVLRSLASHSSFTIERDALIEIGGYRELPAAQDYRMVCELSRRHWLGIMPQVLSFVRHHKNRISHQIGNVQQSLAIDVLSEHLKAISGEEWTREDLDLLWQAGQAHQMSIDMGIAYLERWKSLWEKRNDLAWSDKHELWYYFFYHRWKLLHSNSRNQPIETFMTSFRIPLTKLPQAFFSGLDYVESTFASHCNSKRGI